MEIAKTEKKQDILDKPYLLCYILSWPGFEIRAKQEAKLKVTNQANIKTPNPANRRSS